MADAQEIYRRLQDAGFTPEQAAGIAGDIQQESNFDPTSINAPEGAYGLMQWRGPRRDALEAYAQQQGLPSSDLGVQIGNIARERGGVEAANYARALGPGGTPGDIARRFAQYVERPSDTESYDQRAQYAEDVFRNSGGTPQASYPSPGFVDTGGGTNANVFGGPDPSAPPVQAYQTNKPNPFAATQGGVMFGKDELAGAEIPSSPVGMDPYSTGKAEFGDQLIRTLNPLNLIGTALSLPTMVGAGMRNVMRGAMGLPSDYSALQSKGDLLEQALIANGVKVPDHGFSPREWGSGPSPIEEGITGLFGHSLGEHGREQERIRNLENLYKLTGIQSGIAKSAATDDYRAHMLRNSDIGLDLRIGAYDRAAPYQGPNTQFQGIPLNQVGKAVLNQGNVDRTYGLDKGRFDTSQEAAAHGVALRPATDPIMNPARDDFGRKPGAVAASEEIGLRESRNPVGVLLDAQRKYDAGYHPLDALFGDSNDAKFSEQMRNIDTTLYGGHGLGKYWAYRTPEGGVSTDKQYAPYGVTQDLPPEKPSAAAAATVGGMVSGTQPPPASLPNPDRGPNLAEGKTVTEGGSGGPYGGWTEVQVRDAVDYAKRQANHNYDLGIGRPWESYTSFEKRQLMLESLNRKFPKK